MIRDFLTPVAPFAILSEKGRTIEADQVKLALEKLSARVGRSVKAGIWAHLPTIAVVALFFVASRVFLDSGDYQLNIKVGALIIKLRETFTFFIMGATVLGLIWLVLTPSRDRSIASVLNWILRRNWFEIVLWRIPLALALTSTVNYIHLKFKVNIPRFGAYSWDQFFAEFDRVLFFGYDPWVLTHAVFSSFEATFTLDAFYRVWFLMLQFSIFCIVALPLRNHLRLTFLLAYSLNWAIGGALLAIMMPAAGPVYMERLYGDPTFEPLMELLRDQARIAPLTALAFQEWLWDGLTKPEVSPFGISAFPSLHVQMAATSACLGFCVHRILGWILTVFAAVILIGSVHLGWHYAIDGIAGIVLAVVLWRISARVTRWWLARTEPGTARETAAA